MSKFSTIISVIQMDVFRVRLSWTVHFFLINAEQVISLLVLNLVWYCGLSVRKIRKLLQNEKFSVNPIKLDFARWALP